MPTIDKQNRINSDLKKIEGKTITSVNVKHPFPEDEDINRIDIAFEDGSKINIFSVTSATIYNSSTLNVFYSE